MTAVNPVIRLASRIKIPTLITMLVVYVGLIALLSTVIASLVPAVVAQTKGLTQAVPGYLTSLEDILNTEFDPGVIAGYFNSIPGNLVRFAASAFGNILNILAVFFLTYYLMQERPHLHKYLVKLFPYKDAEQKAESMVLAIERAVGGWVRGQLLLMLLIGVMTYVGLVLLGIPYALPLAVIAGTLELVPGIGPIIAAIPAVFIGFTVSPFAGIGAVVLVTLIQQLENNLIVPRVMEAATGMRPLVTIVVLLVGYSLGGVTGAIFGIPLFLTAQTIYQHLKR
jgi:predicted PurR-regulated permease PerM